MQLLESSTRQKHTANNNNISCIRRILFLTSFNNIFFSFFKNIHSHGFFFYFSSKHSVSQPCREQLLHIQFLLYLKMNTKKKIRCCYYYCYCSVVSCYFYTFNVHVSMQKHSREHLK